MGVILIQPKLLPNQRIDILLAPGSQAERYPSRIEEINSRHLILAMPMSKGVPLFLSPENVFYGRLACDGSAWLFASRFVDKSLQPLPVWVCSLPYDFRKIQMRSFVRLETALPVELRSSGDGADAPPLAATTRDIGGGGMQLATRVPLPAGASVDLIFTLGEFGRFEAVAEIVRAEFDTERRLGSIAVKFVDMPERERDKIIKYIFKKQLERRQKGF